MNLLVPVNELADPFLDADARLEAQHPAGMDQIGIRQSHVARLIGVAFDDGVLAQGLSNQRDQPIQAHPLAAAKIDRLDRTGRSAGRPLQGGKDAVQAVGNIGIVATAWTASLPPWRDRKSTRLNSSHPSIS